MIALELLQFCRAHDVRLWSDAGELHFDAPCGVLDEAIAEALSDHRVELLGLVS